MTRKQIEALNHQYQVKVVGVSGAARTRYTFQVTGASNLSVAEIAQLYYEKLPAAWSMPDFIMSIKRNSLIPNDTHFPQQYYFDNANNVDINAPQAWDHSTGDPSIVIAVIDMGGEAHEDLPASRIVPGYDFVPEDGDSDPSPEGNEAHGMAVAGIIASTQNNSKGISGLAPNCKVMFLRVFDELGVGVAVSKFADAIEFAWTNGADVINNSWGTGDTDPNAVPAISDAIDDALTQGRNGKGCVVVFSAGNDGVIEFPANRPGVLAVGAVDQSNNVWNYSGKGTELAVVAPSGDIETLGNLDPCMAGKQNGEITQQGDVWSLDRPGAPGYNPGNYNVCVDFYHNYLPNTSPASNNYATRFGGTSATAPQVSGVAALMLSVNPSLVAKPSNPQVQSIIKDTAVHPSPGSRPDNNYGYGRVDAAAAVQEAVNVTHVTNPPSAPGGLTITNAGNVGENPILSWSVSSGADYYRVYRRVSFDPDWVFMGTAVSTSYQDNTLTIKAQGDPMTHEFLYQVKGVNFAGESGPSNTASVWGFSFYKQTNDDKVTGIPEAFELEQNYPNPFNPETELRYTLPTSGEVELVIMNLLGQTVRTLVADSQSAGRHSKVWDGRNDQGNQVASGIYLYRISVKPYNRNNRFTQVRKMSLLR
ncbi:MAG: S8 family serine peptidase [bacterium]